MPWISQGVRGRAKSKLWWLSPEVCSAKGGGTRPFAYSAFNHLPSDSLGRGHLQGGALGVLRLSFPIGFGRELA